MELFKVLVRDPSAAREPVNLVDHQDVVLPGQGIVDGLLEDRAFINVINVG